MRQITIDTTLSLDSLKKQLEKAERQVEKFKAKLEKQMEVRVNLQAKAEEAGMRQEQANIRLNELKSSYAPASAIKEQEATVRALYSDYEKAANAVDRQDAAIQSTQMDLTKAQANAANLSKSYEEAAAASEEAKKNTKEMPGVVKALGKGLDGIGKVIKRSLRRIFLLTMVLKAIRSIKNYFGEVIKNNDEAATAIGRLKGAFQTMAQPIIGVVIPAITTLVNWLTTAVTAINQLYATITGKSLKDMQKAASDINKKNKSSSGGKSSNLANFDQINTISSGSGSASGQIEALYDVSELESEELYKILGIISLIGAAFAAWRLPFGSDLSFFTRFIGYLAIIVGTVIAIMGYMDAWENGLNRSNMTKIFGGLALAIGGILLVLGPAAAGFALVASGIALVVLALKDISENGPNAENIITLLAGAAAAAAGTFLVFGSAGLSIVAAIALIVAGGLLVVNAFKDMGQNGVNLANTLKMVAGIFLTGLGLSLILGPAAAVVGAITAIIFALVALGGNGDEVIQHIKDIFGGLVKFINDVFAGDWEAALTDLKDIGVSIANLFLAVVEGVIKAAIKGINFIIDKINTLSWDVPNWVPGIGGQHWGFGFSHIGETFALPRLATGAVIPPNREFMAVLGDQKSGTNIEAPLDTIVQAMQMALNSSGNNKNINISFTGSMGQLARALKPALDAEAKRSGYSLVVQTRG